MRSVNWNAVQGLTTGGAGGTALLHESVKIARDSPGQLELALSRAERRANRRTAAREPPEEGLALAHQCGARSLQERALADLLAAGARPRRPPAPVPAEVRRSITGEEPGSGRGAGRESEAAVVLVEPQDSTTCGEGRAAASFTRTLKGPDR